MYSVRGSGEIDPDQADWIVGSFLDRQLLIDFHFLPRELRIVIVFRIPTHAFHLENACGRGFFLTAEGRGIEPEKAPTSVVRSDVVSWFVNDDSRRGAIRRFLERHSF